MLEFLKMGYKVIVGSPYGDFEILDESDCEIYESAELEEHDDDAKVAYFYDEIWDN